MTSDIPYPYRCLLLLLAANPGGMTLAQIHAGATWDPNNFAPNIAWDFRPSRRAIERDLEACVEGGFLEVSRQGGARLWTLTPAGLAAVEGSISILKRSGLWARTDGGAKMGQATPVEKPVEK